MKGAMEKINETFRENKIYYLLVLLFFCVADVTEISECLFIEFKNKDEISLIVPINAFKSEEDAIEFKQKLKEK